MNFLMPWMLSGSRRRHRRACGGASAILAAVVACSPAGEIRVPLLATDARTVAPTTFELRTDRDDPLEIQFVAARDDSTLIVVEKGAQAIWEVKAGHRASHRRLTESVSPRRRRIMGIAAAGNEVAMVDINGVISQDDPAASDPRLVAHLRPSRRSTFVGFARTSDGTFTLAQSTVRAVRGQVLPVDTIVVTRLIPPDSEEVVWKWERSGRETPYGLMTDFLSLASSTDTLTLSGSAPPRATIWTVKAPLQRVVARIAGIPRLPMVEGDRAMLAAELKRRGVSAEGVEHVTAVYPPVVGVRRISGGWVVVGAAGTERFHLAVSCDSGASRMLARGPDLSRVFLLDRRVLLIRDHLDEGYVRIESSAYDDFATGCTS